MVDAATYINELDAKNKASIEKVLEGTFAGFAKEGLGVADLLKVDLKLAIESAEIAALWIPESDDLEVKLSLCAQCGDDARLYQLLWARLVQIGVDVAGYDPRHGGYSKLFAFMRSLQTVEERAAAGPFTWKGLGVVRAHRFAAWCTDQGDAETGRLYAEVVAAEEQKQYEIGHRTLVRTALNEESQARARRASYRTLELVGEMNEPSVLRKLARPKK